MRSEEEIREEINKAKTSISELDGHYSYISEMEVFKNECWISCLEWVLNEA